MTNIERPLHQKNCVQDVLAYGVLNNHQKVSLNTEASYTPEIADTTTNHPTASKFLHSKPVHRPPQNSVRRFSQSSALMPPVS